jgi:hypothetical protein
MGIYARVVTHPMGYGSRPGRLNASYPARAAAVFQERKLVRGVPPERAMSPTTNEILVVTKLVVRGTASDPVFWLELAGLVRDGVVIWDRRTGRYQLASPRSGTP